MARSARLPRHPHFEDHVVRGRNFRVARWSATAGPPSRPLLFFTGIGANAELLTPFLAGFHGRDIVTFDMPGIGGSPSRGGPYRLSSMADAADRILADLGYGEIDVMGASWGGLLAQEFACRYPHRTAKLVLAATTAGMPMIPGRPSTLAGMATSFRYAKPAAMLPSPQSLYGGNGRDLESYAARMRAPSFLGYAYQLLAIAGWSGCWKLMGMSAETLIIMGRDDKLVPPANGRILKYLIKNAQLEIIDGAGHLFVLTHRDPVIAMVEKFIDA